MILTLFGVSCIPSGFQGRSCKGAESVKVKHDSPERFNAFTHQGLYDHCCVYLYSLLSEMVSDKNLFPHYTGLFFVRAEISSRNTQMEAASAISARVERNLTLAAKGGLL